MGTYKFLLVRYGVAEIDAESEEEAWDKVNDMECKDIDWEDDFDVTDTLDDE